MYENNLNKSDLLKSGTACFLVRYYKEKEKNELLNYLKNNNFEWIKHSSSLPKGQWFFININTKICRVGLIGVGIVKELVGKHAISVNDFINIAEIFKKYENYKFLDIR